MNTQTVLFLMLCGAIAIADVCILALAKEVRRLKARVDAKDW